MAECLKIQSKHCTWYMRTSEQQNNIVMCYRSAKQYPCQLPILRGRAIIRLYGRSQYFGWYSTPILAFIKQYDITTRCLNVIALFWCLHQNKHLVVFVCSFRTCQKIWPILSVAKCLLSGHTDWECKRKVSQYKQKNCCIAVFLSIFFRQIWILYLFTS